MTDQPPPMNQDDIMDASEPFRDLAKHTDAPVAPAQGIAAIALSLAVKYHDVATIKDGTLYQQYKLEGRNLVPLHLDMVFDTAIRMEAHLLGASDRIAKLIVDALAVEVEEDKDGEASGAAMTDDRSSAGTQVA